MTSRMDHCGMGFLSAHFNVGNTELAIICQSCMFTDNHTSSSETSRLYRFNLRNHRPAHGHAGVCGNRILLCRSTGASIEILCILGSDALSRRRAFGDTVPGDLRRCIIPKRCCVRPPSRHATRSVAGSFGKHKVTPGI